MRWWFGFVLVVGLCAGCSSGPGGSGGNAGSGGNGGAATGGGGTGGEPEGCPTACPTDEYCMQPECRGPGSCTEIPETCTDVIDPVCGCDGETYDNSCLAAAAGVSVDEEGPCPCFRNDQCEPNAYCLRSPACQAGPGACEPRPESCLEQFDPVCGCDGNTYDNACFANAAGILVSAEQPCDCDTNNDCDPTEYCNGVTCDGPGFCDLRPLDCPDEEERVPTCDGVLYFNACFAAQAGTRIRPLE